MRVIVAGGRTVTDRAAVYAAIEAAAAAWGEPITCVLSGGTRGVDSFGEDWAHEHQVPVETYPADWLHGLAAGPIRNRQMARAAGPGGGLVLVWDGKSRGSRSMLGAARSLGLKIHEVIL